MENGYTCPVCSKTGIPDFRNENVVCPCCGTDLSIYRKISIAQKSLQTSGNNKKSRLLATITSIIAIASLIACFYMYHNNTPKSEVDNKDLFAQINELKQENKSLSDSIVVLNKKGQSIERRTYTVVKGDCPWSISEKVFGDGRRYDELLRLNNMSTSNDFNKVKVGETLYIE